jgi:hypothetical protein|tara:strand:- start:126 stop:326 length:201 start_codon:yes stop_codon:yes gene_type:complete
MSNGWSKQNYKNHIKLKEINMDSLETDQVENEIEIVVEGGMVVEVNGLPSDWVFYITDHDCEFENE